jgi:hypothetical protein
MPLCGSGESRAAEPRRSARRRQAVQPSQQDALAESVWSAQSPWVAHHTHPYLLTRHHGGIRWFRCSKCEYWNDRFYHAKMHYERIHVNQGRCMPSRRKYRAEAAPRSATPPRKRKCAAPRDAIDGKSTLPRKRKCAAPGDGVDGKSTLPLARVFTFGSPFFQDEGPGLLFDAAGMRAFELPLFAEDRLSSAAAPAAEDDDLGYLMPGYRLWDWEKFDLSDLVAGELEHWLCVHNKSTTQPPDAVHREAEMLLELMRARVRRSRVALDSCLRQNK